MSSKIGQTCSLAFCICMHVRVPLRVRTVHMFVSAVVLSVTLDFVSLCWVPDHPDYCCVCETGKAESNSSSILLLSDCKYIFKKRGGKKDIFAFSTQLITVILVHIQVWLMATRMNVLCWRSSCVRRKSSSWTLSKSCRWGIPSAERRKNNYSLILPLAQISSKIVVHM